MQDTELFLSLAEIAGVFVGFGALISMRSSDTNEAFQLTYVRGLVWVGILVVAAGLAPVTISRYGITGHALWLVCSLLVLALFWAGVAVNSRMPEHAALFTGATWAIVVRHEFPALILWAVTNIALILVVLGLFPDLEPALYLTAVVAVLLQAAFYLLQLVYSRGHPRTA